MEEEISEKLETDMFVIWQEAFGVDVHPNIQTCFMMYEKLLQYWKKLTEDEHSLWEYGYKCICESLGNAYFMFDTDIPEQDNLIYDLVEIVLSNKDSLAYKRTYNKIQMEKIEQDFE